MRKIFTLTERRADYGRIKAVLQEIQQSRELELALIVTGAHLLPEQGNTIEVVKKDGFPIDAIVPVFSGEEKDTGADMVRALGRAIIGMTNALEKIKPDILLVGFDLGAHLAAAIAGAHMNLPIAHLEGGEVTGSIDESIRHAITRFAHIHLPTSELGKQRLIAMGENPKYIFCVGDPALDIILNMEFIPAEKLAGEFKLDLSRPVILVVQHPVTTEADEASGQVLKTLSAVKRAGEQAIFICPNVDAGGRRMREAFENARIQLYENMPFETFTSLMKISSVMVGNSSSAIREAPIFHLPAVNIGTRQNGRERAGNVIDVGYDEEEIYQAIRKAIHDQSFRQKLQNLHNPYGDGKASQKIVEVLKSIDLTDRSLIQKRLAY